MALYYNTETFSDIVEDVGAQLDANKLTPDTIEAYVKGRYDIDKEDYNNAINEAEKAEKEWYKYKEEYKDSFFGPSKSMIPAHLRKQEESTFDAIMGWPGRATASLVRGTGKGITQSLGMAIEGIAGKETTEKISDTFKEVDNTLSKNPWTKPIVETLKETFDPQTAWHEEMGGHVIGALYGTGIATKAIQNIAPKLPGYLTRTGGFVAYEVAATDKDMNIARGLVEGVPEEERNDLEKALAILAINENDPNSIKILKKAIETTALGAGTEVIVSKVITPAIRGYKKWKGKSKAIKEDKILNPPEDDSIKQVKVVNKGDDSWEQQVTIGDNIKLKVNETTGIPKAPSEYDTRTQLTKNWLKRWLTSRQGFDEQTFQALETVQRSRRKTMSLIQQTLKSYFRAIKDTYGVSYKKLDDDIVSNLNDALGVQPVFDEVLPSSISKILNKVPNKRTAVEKSTLEKYTDKIYNTAHIETQEAVKKLPPAIQEQIKELRFLLDKSSDELIQSGIPSKGMSMVMDKKKGIYVTTDYEIYTNPAWQAQVKKVLGKNTGNKEAMEAVNLAKQYFRRNMNLPEDEINRNLNKFMEDVSGDDLAFIELMMPGRAVRKAQHPMNKILTAKRTIPEELRPLFREIKDPHHRFASTLEKQSRMIAEHKFLQSIRQIAESPSGKSFYGIAKSKTNTGLKPEFTEKLEDLSIKYLSKPLSKQQAIEAADEVARTGVEPAIANPLSGVHTTKIYKEMLQKGLDVNMPDNKIVRLLLQINRGLGGAQTIGSEATHLINIEGNVIFTAANGNTIPLRLPGAGAYKTRWEALKNVTKAHPGLQREWGRLMKVDNKSQVKISTNEFAKLQGFNLIDSGVTQEFFLRTFDDAFMRGDVISRYATNPKWYKMPWRALSKVYRGEDSLFKVYNYYVELGKYIKAYPNVPIADIEKLAAENVKTFLPTYSRVPRILKTMQTVPVIGVFPSFLVESIRAGKGVFKLAGRDIILGVKTGNTELMKIGMERLAAATAVGITGSTYHILNNLEKDISPKTDKIIENNLLPFYEVNNNRAWLKPLEMKKNGQVEAPYVNTSRANPYTAIEQSAEAAGGLLLSGKITSVDQWEKAINDFGMVLQPLFSESLLFQPFKDIISGKVRPPEGVNMADKLGFYIKHITKGAIPRTWSDWARKVDAESSEKILGKGKGTDEWGFPNRPEDRIARLLGYSRTTFNLNRSLQLAANK